MCVLHTVQTHSHCLYNINCVQNFCLRKLKFYFVLLVAFYINMFPLRIKFLISSMRV
jgi:hypothetical protein